MYGKEYNYNSGDDDDEDDDSEFDFSDGNDGCPMGGQNCNGCDNCWIGGFESGEKQGLVEGAKSGRDTVWWVNLVFFGFGVVTGSAWTLAIIQMNRH